MPKKKRNVIKLQEARERWQERKHRTDDQPAGSASGASVARESPCTSQDQSESSLTSQDERFVENVPSQSILEKRALLIREVMGAHDAEITEGTNAILCVDSTKAEFQAASPVCGKCLAKLEISFDDHRTKLQVKCVGGCTTQDKKEEEEEEEVKQVLDTHEILIFYCLEHGMGFTGYSDLLSYLKLKQIGIDTFYKLRKKVGKMILNKSMEKKETMKKCVFHHYERLGHTPDEDGILNVDVTCDGTYLTRGYKSHIGIVAVIETETGFLLDFEVLSNFCLVCTQLSNKLKLKKLSAEEYNEKIDMHAAKCTHTFEGKSGGMEAEGARILWKRSIEQLNMRYVTFVGDGDSTAFTAVCALNDGKGPYEGIQVKKEECINHVSKRLGTRLRKLKAEEVVEKQTKTGKTFRRSLLGGKNKLTDFVIDKLTNYYGQAVRRNVLLTYLHVIKYA